MTTTMIFELFVYITQVALCIVLFFKYTKKDRSKLRNILFILFITFFYCFYSFSGIKWLGFGGGIILQSVLFLSAILILNINWIQGTMGVAIVLLMNTLVFELSGIFYSLFFGKKPFALEFNIMVLFFEIIITVLLLFSLKADKFINSMIHYKARFFFLAYILIMDIITNTFNNVTQESDEFTSFLFIGLIFSACSVTLIILITKRDYDNDLTEKLLELEKNKDIVYNMIHEHKKLNTELEKALQSNKLVEATIISDITKDYVRQSFNVIRDNEVKIEALIKLKREEAIQNNIKFTYKISLPDNFNLNITNMILTIRNMLDNSIEASLNSSEKEKTYINFIIKHHQNMLTIQCENYYDFKLNKNSDTYNTTKELESDIVHGRGTKIIQQFADDNNGICLINDEDNVFKTTLIFY